MGENPGRQGWKEYGVKGISYRIHRLFAYQEKNAEILP